MSGSLKVMWQQGPLRCSFLLSLNIPINRPKFIGTSQANLMTLEQLNWGIWGEREDRR